MNVFFFTRWYPDKFDPSFGLFIQRHAEAVSKFCKVSIIYIRPDENLNKSHELEFDTFNNISVVKIYYRKYRNSGLLNLFLYYYYFTKGYKYLKRLNGRPDIVHVNILTRTGLPALYLKCFYAIPFIITEHWSRYQAITNNFNGILRKIITRLIVKQAFAVTTVTENLKQSMLKHKLNNNNYHVIPNVVNTDIFIPDQNKIPNNKVIITHISSFEDKSKNVTGILNVIKKLSFLRDDFELRLIGDLNDKKKLSEYSEEIELKDKFVFFDGLLETNQLVKVLQRTDFLLMFSNYENLPVVINEALSCGIPIVATKVGGIPEYINEDLGLLVNPGNEEELMNAVKKMMNNYKNYNKEVLRRFAIDNFSMDKVAQQFVDIYNEALRN